LRIKVLPVEYSVVIPGRDNVANPESHADNLWIPGLRQVAHPGMTAVVQPSRHHIYSCG
jgi:hypothetical protein